LFSEFGKIALEEAEREGASYADIRISEILNEILTVKNGEPEAVNLLQTKGFGVRVIADGAWGFAGSIDVNKEEIMRIVEKAVNIAKASALLKKKEAVLIPEEAREDQYSSEFQKDPFKIPVEEKLDVLVQAGRILKKQSSLIKAAYTNYRGYRENKLFMSTEGARISQKITWCGGGLSAIAVKNGEMQTRSYPSSFGGNNATSGYEFFESLALVDHAKETGKNF